MCNRREGQEMDDADDDRAADEVPQRAWAVQLFNRVWTLLEQPDRTPEDDATMIHAAHTSCFHWMQIGTPVNAVRGEWQCARVYATLGRGEPGIYHARRALAICQANGIEGFDLAYAYEALARAHGVSGDHDGVQHWKAKAIAALATVDDPEDKAAVEADLDTLPFG